MTDKEKKISKELEQCRSKITETKRLIEYHKDILKKQESRENSLTAKLEKEKFYSLCEVINKGGYDVDMLRSAVQAGDFSGVIPVKADNKKSEEKQPQKKEDTAAADKSEEDNITENERKV